MGDLYLLELADVLRADPYPVVELDGWQYRARGSGGYTEAPWCVMWHHTASAGDGLADAEYCTYVDEDAPLCNVVVGRDGTRYVCAGGATNTNGKGGPLALPDGRVVPADSMNSRAVGIEISNNGVGQTYPAAQIDSVFATSNAIAARWCGRPDQLAEHVDWAPGRKIDPATAAAVDGPWQPAAVNGSGSWALGDLRAEALTRATGTPTGDDDMTDEQARQLADVHRWITGPIEPSMFTDPGGNPMSVPWGVGWTWSLLQDVNQAVADLAARVARLEQ